jgi:hypothetical protein
MLQNNQQTGAAQRRSHRDEDPSHAQRRDMQPWISALIPDAPAVPEFNWPKDDPAHNRRNAEQSQKDL